MTETKSNFLGYESPSKSYSNAELEEVGVQPRTLYIINPPPPLVTLTVVEVLKRHKPLE
jgi:hypothetical protein